MHLSLTMKYTLPTSREHDQSGANPVKFYQLYAPLLPD